MHKNCIDFILDTTIYRSIDEVDSVSRSRRKRRQFNRKFAKTLGYSRKSCILAYCDYVKRHGFITGDA